MNNLTKRRLREKLAETASDTRNAATKGATYVFQREDGAVLSSRTGFWSYDLSDDALHAGQNSEPILGAVPVSSTFRAHYIRRGFECFLRQ